jgi:hypothetical protein
VRKLTGLASIQERSIERQKMLTSAIAYDEVIYLNMTDGNCDSRIAKGPLKGLGSE